MAKKKILVTGGSGFIGSFLVDRLVREGHDVRIFDDLEEQVHQGHVPDYLNKEAEFIKGDVRDYEALKKALEDVEVVFHKASMVGVGQSQYQVKKYVDVNTGGTANLLDILVKKIMVAASMSSYGEGYYRCGKCGVVEPGLRKTEDLEKGDYEIHCPKCNSVAVSIPTDESKKQSAPSIYAISKKNQEEMVLAIGRSYGIPAVALRFFNVYGPRQSLSNPYTGVAAIFLSRIKNKNQPLIFEDGLQTRDFISVHDVVESNILAMNSSAGDYESFNVGSGKPITIIELAKTLAKLSGSNIQPRVTGEYRKGDVKHCYADITKIKNKLGFKPKVTFEQGITELMHWSETQKAVDGTEKATQEMRAKGLIK
jgi:dTDP-L-rhamnose 4-epimerase